MPPPGFDPERVKEVFFAALDLAPSERAVWVRSTCAEEPALLAEVLSLLDSEERGGAAGFLEGEPRVPHGAEPPAETGAALPSRIGGYRVLRLLGRGGMGVVYLAEQQSTGLRVALKVLRQDCGDEAAQKRFEREARALARLRHPGIAQVHDAGVAQVDGGRQPYLAMEHVDGRGLRDAVRELGREERIELLARVCDAVQHAHEHGVLHRDLKPDNVLVEATGQPVVVDFGVARLEDAEASFRTHTGHLIGTLTHMSPEQARGERADERSDQYALGVLLYEALTEHLPFDTRDGPLHELLLCRTRDEPVPLPERVPALRGDLTTIVHRALDAVPARRYGSVGELAEDLRLFLAGRPIRARPPTASYRLRKLVQRHRGLAAAVLVTIVVLSAGLALALAGWRAARTANVEIVLRTDGLLLRDLVERADDLWPVAPALVPSATAWLAEAAPLEGRLPRHRAELARLERERIPDGDDWLLEHRRGLIAGLERFFAPGGTYGAVRERLRASREVAARTVGDHAEAWGEALAALEIHPAYRLQIEPQVGLVPLGPDPRSGLWEFGLYGATGDVPARDPRTGELEFGEGSGLVLVLLPGGTTRVGVQSDDPGGLRYDPWAQSHEGPVVSVELDPFFLSKYEMTQAQWLRCEGDNPSYWRAGKQHDGIRFTLLHPVEHVSWDEALDLCGRLGATLPTEARWEHAARGGTETLTWAGPGRADMVGRMNGKLNDVARDLDLPRSTAELDRYELHAPVGTFQPNPFGLHEILGNVFEWCRDVYKVEYHELPRRAGDGEVVASGDEGRSMRGGCFFNAWPHLRVGFRSDAHRTHQGNSIGIRPARDLAGSWRRLGSEDVARSSGRSELR